MSTYLNLLLLLFLSSPSIAFCQWWQTNGPEGGKVTDIVSGDGDIYCSSVGSGANSSSNGAELWSACNIAQSDHFLDDLHFENGKLYGVSGLNGLFWSTDGGDSWTLNPGSMPGAAIFSRCILMDGQNWYIGTEEGIYKSADSGANWTFSNNGLGVTEVRSLAKSTGVIVAGTYGAGMYRSTDNGLNWSVCSGISTTANIYCTESLNNVLYAGTASGLLKSVTGGQTWTTTGLTSGLVQCIAASGSELYVGLFDGGVKKSTDNGDTWVDMNTGLYNYTIEKFLTLGDQLYCATYGDGVYWYDEIAGSWIPKNKNLKCQEMSCFSADPAGALLAGTSYNGLYRTLNGGSAWIASNNGISSLEIIELVSDVNASYALTAYNKVYKSTDNGVSWSASSTGITSSSGQAMAYSNNKLFVGTVSGGVFKSIDMGATWSAVNSGLTDLFIQSLAASGDTLLAATSSDGVFRSYNAGSTWSAINTGLANTNIQHVAIHGGKIIAIDLYGDQFMAPTNGSSWTAVTNSGVTSAYTTTFSNGKIYIGGIGDLTYTSNGGTSWSSLLNNSEWTSNTLEVVGGVIYTGTQGNSVVKRNISGLTSFSISGKVTNSNGSQLITSGKVYLYTEVIAGAGFQILDSTTINTPGGTYSFSGLNEKTYLLKAKPDLLSYPLLLNTYYGDAVYWLDATQIILTADLTNADIHLIESPQGTGTGYVSGIVQYGDGAGKTGISPGNPLGDPVPGIDVSLEQIPGGIIRTTTTNALGFYEFSNLVLNQVVRVVVDLPGLPMDSTYTVEMTVQDSVYINLDFVVDTASNGDPGIYIGYPLGLPSEIGLENHVTLYPNPTKHFIKISGLSPDETIKNITAFDLSGKQVAIDESEKHISLEVSQAGTYLLIIETNHRHLTKKILVTGN